MNNNLWDADIWKQVDDAVMAEVDNRIRIAQKAAPRRS
jgi:hypothetical protein